MTGRKSGTGDGVDHLNVQNTSRNSASSNLNITMNSPGQDPQDNEEYYRANIPAGEINAAELDDTLRTWRENCKIEIERKIPCVQRYLHNDAGEKVLKCIKTFKTMDTLKNHITKGYCKFLPAGYVPATVTPRASTSGQTAQNQRGEPVASTSGAQAESSGSSDTDLTIRSRQTVPKQLGEPVTSSSGAQTGSVGTLITDRTIFDVRSELEKAILEKELEAVNKRLQLLDLQIAAEKSREEYRRKKKNGRKNGSEENGSDDEE